jgi:5-methylcytosine-specific restriction protein A
MATTRNNGKYRKRIIKKALFIKQKGICNLCGNKLDSLAGIDHIIPLGMDGEENVINMQLLCLPCNLEKTNQDLVDIWAYRKKGGKEK